MGVQTSSGHPNLKIKPDATSQLRPLHPQADYAPPRASAPAQTGLLRVATIPLPTTRQAERRFGVGADSGTMSIFNDPILIGHRLAWGGEIPFGIRPTDARHHCYIIGKTGSGKSALLRNLIIQHIHRGHGVAIIDPHGDLAEDLLSYFPPSRADHLVYLKTTILVSCAKPLPLFKTKSAPF